MANRDERKPIAEYQFQPQPETLKNTVEEMGLSIRAEFVPWSKSRHAKPDAKIDDRSLNWQVTLVSNAPRDILTTEYSAGIAHCPSYKRGKMTLFDAEHIEFETERGKQAQGDHTLFAGKPIEPDPCDVIFCLIRDSNVLDCSSFEDWASKIGYDPDSRSAEKIYQTCLKIALELRNGVGKVGLAKLWEATQDY